MLCSAVHLWRCGALVPVCSHSFPLWCLDTRIWEQDALLGCPLVALWCTRCSARLSVAVVLGSGHDMLCSAIHLRFLSSPGALLRGSGHEMLCSALHLSPHVVSSLMLGYPDLLCSAVRLWCFGTWSWSRDAALSYPFVSPLVSSLVLGYPDLVSRCSAQLSVGGALVHEMLCSAVRLRWFGTRIWSRDALLGYPFAFPLWYLVTRCSAHLSICWEVLAEQEGSSSRG